MQLTYKCSIIKGYLGLMESSGNKKTPSFDSLVSMKNVSVFSFGPRWQE
jgi:hypothetical protein